MAFLTSSIGSFPKPPALHEARRRFVDGEIDADALRQVEDEAMRRILAFQDDLGVDLLVDGEMDRADPITTFAERLGGVEIDGWVRVYGERYVRKPKITGPLVRTASSTVTRWRAARDGARGAVKVVIPGPYSLMDGSFDEHHRSRSECCAAFAQIVQAEAAELAAAGVTEIQLDEPSAGARPDELPMLRDAIEQVVAPLRGRARVWLYLGYANLSMLGEELATLPAQGLLVAGAHCDYEGLETFARALPADRVAGVGVVDVLDARVESADEIRARAALVAKHIPPDRLWLVPDGGFRALLPPAARAKLAAMVEAAR
jgi:5-methyltetrahydropteroyltriglutamate--homocysteine methyltransferase